MERRLYGPGARLALLVSLCMMSAPTTQGNTEVVGAVGRGRDFELSSVDYLGYHGAAARRGCCRQCTREYPGAQMFSYNTQAGICACMKRTPGVNPTTTEGAGSFAGICGGRGRGRSQRRRRAGRRGRGRRAGAASPSSSPTMAPDPKCIELVACVQCQQFNSGEYMDGVDDVDQDGVERCYKCPFKPVGVELKEEGWAGFPSLANDPVCTFLDDDMCRFSFVYRYLKGGRPVAWVQKNKTC